MKLKNLVLPFIALAVAGSIQAREPKAPVKMASIKNSTKTPIAAHVIFGYQAKQNDLEPNKREVFGELRKTINPGQTAFFDATKATPLKGDKKQAVYERLQGLKDITIHKIVAGGKGARGFSKQWKDMLGSHHTKFEVRKEQGKTAYKGYKVMNDGKLVELVSERAKSNTKAQ